MTWKLRAFFLVFLGGASAVLAEDWPQWRGPDRTGHVPDGITVPAALPASPKVVWRIPLGFGIASPVVSGGKVIYIDNQKEMEVVHAADAKTGKVLWDATLDTAHKDSQSASGPRCTPLADGGRVYAQSCRGELQCLNLDDGKVIWRTNYVKDFAAVFTGEKGTAMGASRHGNNGSPIIDGEHLIALVGGQPDASVVCFDKATGKVIWKSQSDVPGYAAPFIATILGRKQVIGFMAQGAMGLDTADGTLLWRSPVKTDYGRHATTPVVLNDLVVVSSFQVGLIGIKITKDGGGFKAERAWTVKDDAANFSSPVLVGQYLYGVGPQKILFCFDVIQGKQAWSQDGIFSGAADKTEGGLLVMGSNILLLTDDGQLLLIAADPKACREISRVRVCGTNWCTPAYADGRLFVRDAKELLCVQLLP